MTFLAILIVAAIAAWPFIAESRRVKIGRAERQGAPGDFAKLSQGVTYYRWFGPARGPVIVAIHGLTTPSVVFEDLAAGLGGLGYRVLAYDLYGRGLSDAPKGRQSQAFFHQQLDDLLAHQELNEDLTLIGYSMGGSIAATFAATQPERIKRLILLASAGVVTHESAFLRFCRNTPLLGDWLFLALSSRRMTAEIEAVAAKTPSPAIQGALRVELTRQGYLPAVLASRRGMLAESTEQAHRILGKEAIPVIAIWGKQDEVIPITALGQLTQWNRNTLQEVIDDADHALAYSHAATVAERLKGVLRERD